MFSFDDAAYFCNFIVLAAFVAPLYRHTRSIVLRQVQLVVTGMAMIYYIAPRLIVFYVLFWLLVFLIQRGMLHAREWRFATAIMWLSVLLVLTPMALWKLFPGRLLPELAWKLHSVVALISLPVAYVDSHRSLMLPVGLSFATFRALDLVLQTYLGSVDRPSPLHVFAYGFFPAVLPVGPIATIQEMDFDRRATSQDVKEGLLRILAGFAKVFLLASLFQDWGNVFHSYDRPRAELVTALVIYAFYFYLNFAGYSDIAIGTGRLFGMRLPENFNWPLFRENPQQFWANWHASLSRFAQRYIFTSAGGYRRNRQSIALLLTIMVIAWWHDLNLSWTLFGLYHGSGLIAHRWWSQNRPQAIAPHVGSRWYRFICWLLLFTFVVLSFPIISVPPDSLLDFYGRLLK